MTIERDEKIEDLSAGGEAEKVLEEVAVRGARDAEPGRAGLEREVRHLRSAEPVWCVCYILPRVSDVR